MPDRNTDGFGDVRFRPRERISQTQQTSLLALGATIFVAVLLALVTMEVVNSIRAAAAEKRSLAELDAMLRQMEREMAATPSASVVSPASASARRPSLPRLPGPVEARSMRAAAACISGRVAVRVDNGWEGTRQRCEASTP